MFINKISFIYLFYFSNNRNIEKMAISLLRYGHEPCTIALSSNGSTWHFQSGSNSSRHSTGRSHCRPRCARTNWSSCRNTFYPHIHQHWTIATIFWTFLFPWQHWFPTVFLSQHGVSRLPPNCW